MWTLARPGPCSPLVDRDLAVVDALLVHPFPAQPFLPCKRFDRTRRCSGIAVDRGSILSEAVRRAGDCKGQGEGRAERPLHGGLLLRSILQREIIFIAHNITTATPLKRNSRRTSWFVISLGAPT